MTNVLVLMSDEHNARFTSVTGHPRVRTPNLERLAAAGTVYDAAYCISPLCAPSRASFLSGLPPHQTQVYNNCRIDSAAFPSYGAELASHGVHTGMIGKVDAYRDAADLGFSTLLHAGNRASPGDVNFRRTPLAVRADGPDRANGFGPRADAHLSDTLAVDAAVTWLTETATGLDTPWALTVNLTAPHFPHYTTPERWTEYADAGDLPDLGVDEPSASHPYAADLRRHFQTEGFSEEQIRGLRRGYLGCIAFVDEQLGRLLDTLDATRQCDDTVVIYTSDHGEMLGTFGMWWKCSMFEDSLRVPLVAAGPGFEAGTRSQTAASLFDVQAAIFAATGAPRPSEWWGEPLQIIARGDESRSVFAEYHGHGTRSGSFAIRKGSWKLIFNMAAPYQLFDLANDPHERVDRYLTEPAIGDDLERELRLRCDPERENSRAHEHEARQLAWLAAHAA